MGTKPHGLNEPCLCEECATANLAELLTLRARLDTPEIVDFWHGVRIEAAHQEGRHAAHDAEKGPPDWFWTVGYLAGKALWAVAHGDLPKAKHHIVASAALLYRWHCALAIGEM